MADVTPEEGPDPASPLIGVRDLKVHFTTSRGWLRRSSSVVRAVDGVSFDIHRGETLAVVGESGSGKTTLGLAVLQLARATSGSVQYGGADLTTLSRRRMRGYRSELQIIFQDPYSSLDLKMRVGPIIEEPLIIHGYGDTKAERQERVEQLLTLVGLQPSMARRYPHEFSGGQRQRIGIARALAVEPTFLVCDEAVSALDVSIQAQIINLLDDLKQRLGLTYLFIAHDLSVVRHIADRVAVMYLGQIVELASSLTLFDQPSHPYTKALLSAVPVPDPVVERERRRLILKGDVPSPVNPPSGCRFRTRCWLYEELDRPERCRSTEPPLVQHVDNHAVRCHFATDAVPNAVESGEALTALHR